MFGLMSTLKFDLESIYRNHHEKKARYGYLYCDGERGQYIQDWIGKGKKVLDLGCRDGMLTSFFFEGNDVLGVDIDRKALEMAEKRLSIQTTWLDLNTEWPFAVHSFDVIVACEVLEHLFHLDRMLDQIAKTLRPGGLFIGSVPNAFRMRNRWKFFFGNEYENDPTHVRQFSYGRLEATLAERFKEIEIIPIQGKILPLVPVSPKTPFFLNRLFGKDLLWKSVCNTTQMH